MEGRSIWQVGSGDGTRSLAEVFLKYGVALIGPGDPGAWRPDRSDEDYTGSDVRRFAQEVSLGDVILLRRGRSRIVAVGLVASEYLYLPQFDDVQGWDVQHGRRVRWCKLPTDYDFGDAIFGANPRRFGRVAQSAVVEYAQQFVTSPPTHWQQESLPALPQEEALLDNPPEELRELLAEVNDLYPIFWDSEQYGGYPTEDELMAHLVVPLFKALGWRTELLAVKWHYVDLCVFGKLPRIPEHCELVVEAKRLGTGMDDALEQAKGYVQMQNLLCDVLVTDGICYRLFEHVHDYRPGPYANLARLKQSALKLFDRIRRV